MKKYLFMLLAVSMFTCGNAQDNVEATISTDVVSNYIWRGQDLGDASLQPTLGIAYKGLSLSAWGSVGITDATDTKELDFTLGYSVGGFNVGVTDYWFSEGRYFTYGAHSTTHVWEANVGYDFECLNIQWYTNIGGADGVTEKGDRAYSSYVQLSAPFAAGGLDWTATVGAVPFESSFYDASGFAVTHVGLRATKTLTLGKEFELPVFADIVTNPRSEKMFFTLGTTIAF